MKKNRILSAGYIILCENIRLFCFNRNRSNQSPMSDVRRWFVLSYRFRTLTGYSLAVHIFLMVTATSACSPLDSSSGNSLSRMNNSPSEISLIAVSPPPFAWFFYIRVTVMPHYFLLDLKHFLINIFIKKMKIITKWRNDHLLLHDIRQPLRVRLRGEFDLVQPPHLPHNRVLDLQEIKFNEFFVHATLTKNIHLPYFKNFRVNLIQWIITILFLNITFPSLMANEGSESRKALDKWK